MINFIICDDQMEICECVEQIVDNVMMKNSLAYKIHKYNDYNGRFMDWLTDPKQFKIFILDIETPSRSGIDIARLIRVKDKESAIIFLTGHDELGFTVLKSCTNFLTFISKYDDYERNLQNAIREALKMLNVKQNLSFEDHGVRYTVLLSSILYITKDTVDRKTVIKTDSNEYRVYTPIADLTKLLGSNFEQTHRSCLVNMNRVESINRPKNLITFDNGVTTDLLSSKFKRGLKENA